MIIQIQLTMPDAAIANLIANSLVEAQLAACVQIVGPITSTYRWEGKVTQAEEYLCLIKTTKEAYPALEQAIVQLHPYKVPEIIGIPIELGLPSYLQWVLKEVS